jgi:hypothetical protein
LRRDNAFDLSQHLDTGVGDLSTDPADRLPICSQAEDKIDEEDEGRRESEDAKEYAVEAILADVFQVGHFGSPRPQS